MSMRLIIDANIVISMLIKQGKPIQLLLIGELELFAPELLFEEIEQNKKEILRKSEFTEEEIEVVIAFFRSRISVISEEEFCQFREQAGKICPDSKDISYFALALNQRCGLWTNEKRLKEQTEILVYSTHELIAMFLG